MIKMLGKSNAKEASDIIKDGGIVAFPTDTVFGLGICCDSIDAFNRLVKVKNRPADKPFTMMCWNVEQIANYTNISNKELEFLKQFLPGKLTAVVKAKEDFPDHIDLGTGYVGVRVPLDMFTMEFIMRCGTPILVPSANKSGDEPCINSKQVIEIFKDEIEACVVGECTSNIPSTVIKLSDGKIELLRQGAIPFETLEEAWRKL